MPPRSRRSRRRCSTSLRPWARSRPCSRGRSRSPPGGSRAPTGWPPERGWGPVPQRGGQQTELFEQRRWDGAGVGVALIRDGNGTRSFETLLRYRAAAMAEFMHALRTLKALQAGQAAVLPPDARAPAREKASRPAARPDSAAVLAPNEPERRPETRPGRRVDYVRPDPAIPGRTLHEPATPWMPNEPEAERPARLHGSQTSAEPPLLGPPPRSARGERQMPTAARQASPDAVARTNPGTR
jgi:hypothetical protein